MNPIQVVGIRAVTMAGLAGAALLASAGLGAAERKSDNNEASRVRIEQQLEDAQRRLDKAAREVAELSMSLSEEALPREGIVKSRVGRALLGVNIGSDEDDEGEERGEGVEVLSVSPGGAAANAGLKSGDVLLAINNKPLKRDEEGSARSKLLSVMRSVKPGEKVLVKYLRNGKAKSADVITKSVSAERVFSFERRGSGGGRVEHFEIPTLAIQRAEGILGSAELVPLTPKLGQYFGTDKGLLVVRAPTDSTLRIEDGDVILEIDGRAPSSTSHAMRILSSYQAGEKLTLNVLRGKRRTNLEITVPEDTSRTRTDQRFERRIERQVDRSLRALPALPYPPRGLSVAPPAPPAAATSPALRARPAPVLAPLPPLPPDVVIQAVPDDEIEVEDAL